MRLTKYDKSKPNAALNSSITESRSEITNNISTTLSRNIWGQNDDGDDIDGSMIINGDIHIKTIVPPQYEEDEEDVDGENEEYEEGGGSLYVEQNAEIDGDVYAKKHLYINYPENHDTGTKKCVAELIKTNSDEITKLKNNNLTEERVLQLIAQNANNTNGSYNNPIILYSGRIRRSTFTLTTFLIEGAMRNFSMTASVKDGLMTLNITPYTGWQLVVYSVCVTQYKSSQTDDVETTSVKGRYVGAHWFEAQTDKQWGTTKIYIREFHQEDTNNDSWQTSTWVNEYGVDEINVIITGYMVPPTDN